MISVLLIASATSAVFAQTCGNDLLVDDFSTNRHKFFDNADRQINLLGGDYGTDGKTTFAIDTNAKTLTVVPQPNENVFFFAKYDEGACFDLTKYYSFEFELQAPVGATGTFTLTQKSADCSVRVDDGDSEYLPLSKYYRNDGTKQKIVMPFTDFAKTTKGGAFDLVHLKDWTFVDMKPVGQPFVFTNLYIRGGPPGCAPANKTPTPSVGTPTTATGTPVVSIKTDTKVSAAAPQRSDLALSIALAIVPLFYFII